MRGSSEDNSSKCKICNGRDDLDECKDLNDMTVEEKSKFLPKQKLCYGCYEVISPKHTARNCPRRRNCKICLAKHPTGLHGYKIRRKDDSKDGYDPGKTAKNNCANIKNGQCESVRTGEVLSMCVVPVKVRHKNSDKDIKAFAMVDTCSQGTFITTSLMEQLNISGMQTFINIKTLIGHQKKSSYIVEGLYISKTTVSDGNPKWIKLPSAFSKKEIPVDSCEIATTRKLKKWDYLEKISKELGDNEDISVDLLIGANCLEALEPVEFIPRQNDEPYAIRAALGWCTVGPIKAQCHNIVSCNRTAVIKADSGKMTEHHFEIEKGCENIGVKVMSKKIYMTDFNESCLQDADPVTKGPKKYNVKIKGS